MDNIALIESFGDFKDEKGISKIDLMAIIEDSLKTLLRKRYDSDVHTSRPNETMTKEKKKYIRTFENILRLYTLQQNTSGYIIYTKMNSFVNTRFLSPKFR